ncbi:MAG: nucleotidyltransferase family protein [Oscillospiraceae bacterium]|nr:nucleotidyltransferase family protein [Candidatus Ruminococcus equi]
MTDRELLALGYDIIYLISCAIKDEIPEKEKVNNMSFADIYSLSAKHTVTALIGYPLCKCDFLSQDEKVPFSNAVDIAKLRAVTVGAERESILSFMRENGIWYLLMKGLVIRDLYPKSYLREMTDNDILYNSDFYGKVKQFMLSKGYKSDTVTAGTSVDEYEAEPYFYFELHKRFFMADEDLYNSYYADMSKFLVKTDSDFEYKLSDEDFYVYMVLHSFKHYKSGGIGIRFLIDCYLYNEKKKSLDRSYIDEQLKILQIYDFEKEFSRLAKSLFENEKLSKDDEEKFLCYLKSDTFGTQSQRLKKSIEKISGNDNFGDEEKKKYIKNRLFPDLEWFRGNVPFCYNHRWAIPFYDIYRLFSRGIKNRKKIKKEVKEIKKLGRD